jgi:hypothetical protein
MAMSPRVIGAHRRWQVSARNATCLNGLLNMESWDGASVRGFGLAGRTSPGCRAMDPFTSAMSRHPEQGHDSGPAAIRDIPS